MINRHPTSSLTAVNTASVVGRVTTTSGAAISGATVDVGSAASGTTDAEGYFNIPVATSGTYTVTASASGYQPGSLGNVEVRGTGATTLPIRLSP